MDFSNVTEEQIRTYVNKLEETDEENRFRLRSKAKKSLFAKVRTAWKALTE